MRSVPVRVIQSADDCIIIPPPPKISLTSSPPSDDDSPPSPPAISSSKKDIPSPPPAATNESSLSIAETNKLRAKLGLKPLEVSAPTPVPKNDENAKPASELMGGTDMGEFVHKPADNIAQKVQVEKIKAKLAERKEKRLLEAKLSSVKKLGDESDDDDVSKWVFKSRKIQEERIKAERKAKELDDMDAVFGIGELVEEDLRNEKRTLYTNRDLRGLRVEHDVNNFTEGKEVILTLKDKGVLEEGDDTLVNVNMMDEEHYKKNISNRKQNQFGYNALDDEEMDEEDTGQRILKKYNEEIDGAKKSSFTIGVDENKRKELVKKKLQLNQRIESLNVPAPQLAAEYYTEEEMNIKFKKPKRKIRKIRDRKRMLKADDLLADPSTGDKLVKTEEEEWLREIGSRRRPTGRMKGDPDVPPPPIISIKQEPEDVDILMEVDDLPPPPEDISEIKVENDDTELELALKKARRLKQKEAVEIKPSVEKVAEMVLSEEMGYAAPGPGGSIVLNSTAEFCRTLGDIPTYGLSGNRDEDAQEILDFEREMKEAKQKKEEEKTINRGGWNDVELDDKPVDIIPYEAPILDAEPDLGTGVAGALRLAVSKGYLEKETTKRPSASRFAHLQAQNYSIEDKAHVEDEKFGRRERYMGPTCDFKEKDNYKPNVKLDYIDDDGHVLCAKEAFRYLSHKFHGKGPGKNKVEKRMKKNEQEVLMKQMSSTDTPLGTLNMLQQKQKETQSAYIVLSGSKHAQTPASISKTKL